MLPGTTNVSPSVSQPEAPHVDAVVRGDEPEAPCVAAVLRGDEAAVRSWLERGGRANTTREHGEVIGITLLMDAAIGGHERWLPCCCNMALE